MRALMYGGLALFVFIIDGTASAQQTIRGCKIGPRTDCAGADLTGRSLLNADLAGADLWNANLSGADLRRTDLYRADLSAGIFECAAVRRGSGSRADLVQTLGADLRGSDPLCGPEPRNLSGADLSRVELTYAGWEALFRWMGAPAREGRLANAGDADSGSGRQNGARCSNSGWMSTGLRPGSVLSDFRPPAPSVSTVYPPSITISCP